MEFNSFGKVIKANGTAILVAPNVILTCAHNVLFKKYSFRSPKNNFLSWA
jgi:V8-like Glu-specific endopeptidase